MGRHWLKVLLLCTTVLFILGMEGFGGSSDKFPEPKLDYGATITDLEGVDHQARKISFNGDTALTGFRGKASLTITFKRIARVDVTKTETKTYVNAHLLLRDGKEVDLRVKGLARCYGITDLGEMSVRMRDLKTIVFDEKLPVEDQ